MLKPWSNEGEGRRRSVGCEIVTVVAQRCCVVAGGAGGAGRVAALGAGGRPARHLGIARSLTRTGLTSDAALTPH